jgi:Uma2 family endonuclease
MTTPTPTRVTIDDFLAMPEEAPYREYFRGEIWEKAMPNQLHGDCVAALIIELGNYLRLTGEGRVSTEVRHADRDLDWVYLPDLHVTLMENRRPAGRGAVAGHPDFAIEVLSPDDRTSRVLAKVGLYMAGGTALLWVIDPEDETVTVYRRGEPVSVHGAGETLDAKPVLRDFTLDLDAFFASIRSAS